LVSGRRATYRCSRVAVVVVADGPELLPVVELLVLLLALLQLADLLLPSVEAEAPSMGHWLAPLDVGQVWDLHRFECRGRRVLSPVLPVARMKG
jgi:hypothetical protein